MEEQILSSTKITGNLGESVAAEYLMRQGFTVLERNYARKWGEIDLICEKAGTVHFVEVKTVSHETIAQLQDAVARGTWRPEEQVHEAKFRRLTRIIETWLMQHNRYQDWQIDVLALRIVPRETFASVNLIEKVTF